MDVTELRKQLQSYDQEHLLAFWEELNEDEKKSLYHELNQLDLSYVTQSFERCVNNLNAKAEKLDDRMKPVPSKTIFFSHLQSSYDVWEFFSNRAAIKVSI